MRGLILLRTGGTIASQRRASTAMQAAAHGVATGSGPLTVHGGSIAGASAGVGVGTATITRRFGVAASPVGVATVTSALTVTSPFTDNFNRADAALTSPWSQGGVGSGVLGIVSNKVVVTTNDSSNNTSAYVSSGHAAQDVSADFTIPNTNNNAGLLLNGTRKDVGYVLINLTGTTYLIQRNSSTLASFTGPTMSGSVTRTFRLVHDGSGHLSAYVDGTLQTTTTDGTPLTATTCGIHMNSGGLTGASSASADNFSAL